MARLAWQMGVCRGMAAFGNNYQNKTRFFAGFPRPNWVLGSSPAQLAI